MYGRETMPAGKKGDVVVWTGRSGRRYLVSRVEGAQTALVPARLYLLSAAGVIRWVGTAGDLIADQFSRTRFRQLTASGAELLSMAAPEDDLGRMTLAWDLEGTSRFTGRDAA